MDRVAAHDRFAVRVLGDLNFKPQFRAAGNFNRGSDVQQIVVARAALEFQMRLDQRQENAFSLQRGIGHPQPPAHQFRPAALEPFQRTGIVKRPHLVRLAVTDAQLKNILQLAHFPMRLRRQATLTPGQTGADETAPCEILSQTAVADLPDFVDTHPFFAPTFYNQSCLKHV